MTWIGLDVGGANLKAADGEGWALSMPFPLWKRPQELSTAIRRVLMTAPSNTSLAVTMTGELCDCFRSKADGVRHILSAVDTAADGRHVLVYLIDGRLVSTGEATDSPYRAAASNWHALARFAYRLAKGRPGVLIDIGSTTSDIIPFENGQPCPTGSSDPQRLVAGELVYTGVMRTPVCAVTQWLPWQQAQCSVAAELFATTADAYVLLGDIGEDFEATWTADGRPLTRQLARERLARMICADATTFDDDDGLRAAVTIRDAQLRQLRTALARVVADQTSPPQCYVLSGAGEFLARQFLAEIAGGAQLTSIADVLGSIVSACAAAHAVAVLARESSAV